MRVNSLDNLGFRQANNAGLSFKIPPKNGTPYINAHGISPNWRQPIQIAQSKPAILSKGAAGSRVTRPEQSFWGKRTYLTAAISSAALGILTYVCYKYFNPQISPKSPDVPSADRISIPSTTIFGQIAGFSFQGIILGANYWFSRHSNNQGVIIINGRHR